MTKAKPKTDGLTDYAKDQLRRLRVDHDGRMSVTASGAGTIPAIWLGLEESGHVTIDRADHVCSVRLV